jgi:hypothetical protein
MMTMNLWRCLERWQWGRGAGGWVLAGGRGMGEMICKHKGYLKERR